MIRTLTFSAFAAAAAAAQVLAASPAAAQDASGQWSFAFGAGTDNRSKDISKSEGQEYVWALGEWASDSGLFYAVGGFETIQWGGSELEAELGAGVRPQVAGFDVDLNVAHKWQQDADPGIDANAWEFTANVSRSIGPAMARLQLQHSPDGTGPTEAWTWVEGRIGWALNETVTATAAVGRREQDNAIDYTGYNAGVTYAISRNAELDLRWYGTDAEVSDPKYADRLVAEISFAF